MSWLGGNLNFPKNYLEMRQQYFFSLDPLIAFGDLNGLRG
jgi:hypothetical protein